jgi:hypothetical protein
MNDGKVSIRFYDDWDGETREAWTDGLALVIGIVNGDEIAEELSVSLPGKPWSEDELYGILLDEIASFKEGRDCDGAFYTIFEDYHPSEWAQYRGDLSDAVEMHAFLDGMADLIRRAKLAVDIRAEMERKAPA